MTVDTSTAKVEHNGNGSATRFSSSPVVFFAETHVEVTIVDSSGTETKPSLGTGSDEFSVNTTFSANQSTVIEVVYPADEVTPLPNGSKIIIKRVMPLTQDIDLENQDGYLPSVQESGFDQLAMGVLQLNEENSRTILTPIGTTLTSNSISGTIDSTVRAVTITSDGPAATTLGDISTNIDTALSGETNGDLLQYNGTNWVNVTEIDTGEIADDAVTTAKIADNAITLAKMASGTDGNLITFDANGDPAYVATGNAGQVLKSNGAGAAPTMQDETEVGLVLLGSYTASGATSVDIGDGLDLDAAIDGTYDQYLIEFIDLVPATDAAELYMRTSTDGGSNFDSGASDYKYSLYENSSSSSTATLFSSSGAAQIFVHENLGSAAGESSNGTIKVFNPSGTNNTCFRIDTAGNRDNGDANGFTGIAKRDSAADVDALRLLMSTGNIASGEFYLYGAKKS